MASSSGIHDLLIVGGGINGCGIAVDAAGRGLSVLLCEMGDLGSATSSASTKLIHGGLRYLEQYEFRLVRESLAEREVLLRKAPHIIRPLRIRLPHHRALRPRWMIRCGLYLYDFLGRGGVFPRSRPISFGEGGPLLPEFRRGFEYSDALVDDARLVVLNAMQARGLGATVLTRTRCLALSREQGLWKALLRDGLDGTERTVHARAVVNATGPWVGRFAAQVLPSVPLRPLRLVKGCHIVVPRLYESVEAFLLQNDDGRVAFVIPYEQDYTLVGTTEDDYVEDPAQASVSEREVDYLIRLVNGYFRHQLSRRDVLHQFAGVRPLVDGGEEAASKVSRDYRLELVAEPGPLLTVYGGKITTFRKLAAGALALLGKVFPGLPGPWTRDAPLPGGDIASLRALEQSLREGLPELDAAVVQRWARQYGSLAQELAGQAGGGSPLGRHFGHGLFAREVDYLMAREWALTAQDILWRRTKLGLRFTAEEAAALDRYMAENRPSAHPGRESGVSSST